MRYTRRAPACMPASITARSSTSVMPEGTQITTRGLNTDRTAEELKMTIGCVFPRPEEISMEVKGRCLMTGLPRVNHGALLHLGDAGGHADHHPGLEHPDGGHLADELPEHPLGQSVFRGNSERGIYISGVKTMFARDIGIDLGTASVLVYRWAALPP